MDRPTLTREQQSLLGKLTMLIIDDMESMLKVEKEVLLSLGIQKIITASNGNEAWQILDKRKVDLILCDWDMPELNGLGLLEKVRSDQRYESTPFIMVTAVNNADQVKDAITKGVTDFLTKPFQMQELGYRVLKQLRKLG